MSKAADLSWRAGSLCLNVELAVPVKEGDNPNKDYESHPAAQKHWHLQPALQSTGILELKNLFGAANDRCGLRGA